MQIEASVEPLQLRGARIAECERAKTPRQRINEIRCEHLATGRKSADARRDHDRPAVEIVVPLERFTRMQARANSYWQTGKALGDSISHNETRAQGERGRRKRKHEAIALRFHHEPAVFLGSIAH